MDDHDYRDPNRPSPMDGLCLTFGPAVERAITERSRYERETDRIIWIIWVIDEDAEWSGVPQLKAICSTEDSVRYHVAALLQQNDGAESLKHQPRSEEWMLTTRTRFHIERAPCDHFFGSSFLADAQRWQLFTPPISVNGPRKWKYKRDGD